VKQTSLLIKKPWISEKSTNMSHMSKYVFLVSPGATSREIKKAIESIYKIHIVKINVLNKVSDGRKVRKAVVTLKEGENIDIVPH